MASSLTCFHIGVDKNNYTVTVVNSLIWNVNTSPVLV